MNDRELLDLAAKAAGLNIIHMPLPGPSIVDSPNIGILWNPLTDDGDALRLAVKLQLDIAFVGSTLVEVCWLDQSAFVTRFAEEPINDAQGECEAARRAIVRAAAEIGATQPSKDGGGDE